MKMMTDNIQTPIREQNAFVCILYIIFIRHTGRKQSNENSTRTVKQTDRQIYTTERHETNRLLHY